MSQDTKDNPDEMSPEEAERRAKELAHRLLNTPPVKRTGKRDAQGEPRVTPEGEQ